MPDALGNAGLFSQFQVDSLQRQGLSGAGVAVGHLDTGLDPRHPSLRHQPWFFREFDRVGLVAPNRNPFDSAAHGTQTASLIGGREVDGIQVGIAPDCQLYSALVLEHGDVVSRVLCGLAWMLECNVRVLCIPLGIPGYHPVFGPMLRLLRRQGVLLVAPIGNLGSGRSLSPGDYREVLSVGASDQQGSIPSFSGSYHPHGQRCVKPDVLAPAVGLTVAQTGGGYKQVSGTSFACAWVAGVAALLFQAVPKASPDLIEQALVHTSLPLPEEKLHRARGGLVQPEMALEYLLSTQASQLQDNPDRGVATIASCEKYIDPRLQQVLRRANSAYLLDAIFVLAKDENECVQQEPHIRMNELITHITRECGEMPSRIRYFPEAGIFIMKASAVCLRKIIDDPHISVASAADIDHLKLM